MGRVVVSVLFVTTTAVCGASGMDPDFSAIPLGPFPLVPAAPVQPVLTGDDVTDDPALFVADPFLFHEGATWHLFFEAYVYQGYRGKIAHATSLDGLHWTYDRIVLTQQAHLAYPYVFKVDGGHYMLIVPSTTNDVELYRAYDFPYDWRLEATLLRGRDFVDPSIVLLDSVWWIFAGESGSGICRLFWSTQLAGPYAEHPRSPIVNDLAKGRPAGRLVRWGGERLVRLAQKNDEHYGQGVRAFAVDQITPWAYVEHEIPESPVLYQSGHGWNSDGMHTCDPWWNGSHWLAAVDGIADWWTIGIYRSAQLVDAKDARSAGSPSAERIRIRPNPFTGEATILFDRSHQGGTAPVLRVVDASGRIVRVLNGGDATAEALVWDGLDAVGNAVPAGCYMVRLDGAGRARAARAVKLR